MQGSSRDTDIIWNRLTDTVGEGRKERVGCMEVVMWKLHYYV